MGVLAIGVSAELPVVVKIPSKHAGDSAVDPSEARNCWLV